MHSLVKPIISKTDRKTVGLRIASVCVGTAASLLTGCSAFHKPIEVRAPVSNAEFPKQKATKVPAPKDWWKEFGSETLNDLVHQALRQNNSLIASEARIRAALAERDSATAGLFPTVTANGSRSRNTIKGTSSSNTNGATGFSTTSGFSSNSASGGEYSSSLQFSASYEVDLWSRVRASRKAADMAFKASIQDLQAARLSIAAQVVSTWVQWLSQVETVQLLEKELVDYETNLKLVEFRFKQGSAAASDVLQQRQLVEGTRGALAQAKANAAISINALNILLGKPVGSGSFDAEPLPALPQIPDSGIALSVLQRRPDVQSALMNVSAADYQVASAIANQYPQLSLQASISDQNSNTSALFDNWVRNLSVNLFAPIFDGGARAAEVRRQRALLDQQIANYQSTALQALQEVSDAMLQEQSQTQVVESLTKQLTLAEQSLQRLFAGYRNGSVNYLSILNAQQSVSEINRNLLNAKQQLIGFRVALYRAISGPVSLEVSVDE